MAGLPWHSSCQRDGMSAVHRAHIHASSTGCRDERGTAQRRRRAEQALLRGAGAPGLSRAGRRQRPVIWHRTLCPSSRCPRAQGCSPTGEPQNQRIPPAGKGCPGTGTRCSRRAPQPHAASALATLQPSWCQGNAGNEQELRVPSSDRDQCLAQDSDLAEGCHIHLFLRRQGQDVLWAPPSQEDGGAGLRASACKPPGTLWLSATL